MSQIFDEQFYTWEFTEILYRIATLGYRTTINCKLITTREFFDLVRKNDPYLYIYVYTQFGTNPREICRCNSIIEAIKNQIPLPIPCIMSDNLKDIPVVDGCHRMYVCEKLFEPNTKFPVLILTALKISDERETSICKS